ncbi:MAG: hypothetical protein V2I36_06580 [Desulfopila sp.]|nr:hypothetical protein [Desulfopila sp.]
MGNRVYQRIEIDGLKADISDGKGFFPGVVNDVSRFGVCMVDLPSRFDEKAMRMTAVISGRNKNFKILVRPKWSGLAGTRKMVGFEIINTPFDWTDFVMQLEPREDGSVWNDRLF